jgi:hypothetical protein
MRHFVGRNSIYSDGSTREIRDAHWSTFMVSELVVVGFVKMRQHANDDANESMIYCVTDELFSLSYPSFESRPVTRVFSRP